MQYKFRKGDREASDIKKLLKKMKSVDIDDEKNQKSESADGDGVQKVEKPKESLLAKVKAKRKEEKLAMKKRKLEGKRSKSKLSPTDGKKLKKKKKKAAKLETDLEKEERRLSRNLEKKLTLKSPSEIDLQEGRLGQMEIRRLRIKPGMGNGSAENPVGKELQPSSSGLNMEKTSIKDPFFIGGSTGEEGGEMRGKARGEKKQKSPTLKVRKGLRLEKEHS